MNNRTKTILRALVLAAILAVVAGSIIIWDFRKNGPEAKARKENLEYEMSLIHHPEQVKQVDYKASSKPGIALVEYKYSTEISFEQLRTHYDSELSKLNWYYQREELSGGSKILCYSKGEYTATIEYSGATTGWTYAMSLSWGLGKCGE